MRSEERAAERPSVQYETHRPCKIDEETPTFLLRPLNGDGVNIHYSAARPQLRGGV